MKILLIGSSGTLGKAIVAALEGRHEVIGASREGNPRVDLEDETSIETLFHAVTDLDAVIVAAGGAAWKPIAELMPDDFAFSFRSKLGGQIAVIRAAFKHLKDGGSVTVTSGVLAREPMPGAAAVAMVNAGLEGFSRVAALEAPRGIRVNVVSPPWAKPTLKQLGMDEAIGLTPEQIAKAYVAALESTQTGQTFEPERQP
jgi:NAD(P)-dependent dehydrogenase (short-subunit alcohol dehydrogenase family)